MCLAVPLQLIEINGNDAVGERDGIRRNIRVDFIDKPQLGDYVMVHAGFAIERLSAAQAEADLEAAREVEEELAAVWQAAYGDAPAAKGASGQTEVPER